MVNEYIEWSKNNINGKIIEFKPAKINITINENSTYQHTFGYYVINKTVTLFYTLYYIYKDNDGSVNDNKEIFKKKLISISPNIFSIYKKLNKWNEKVISHGDIIITRRDNWVIYDELNGVVLEYSTKEPNKQELLEYYRTPILIETPILEFLKRERKIHTFTNLNPNDYLSNTDVIIRARDHLNLSNKVVKQYSIYSCFSEYFTTYCKIGKVVKPGLINSIVSVMSVLVVAYISFAVVVFGACVIFLTAFLTIEYFYKKVISSLLLVKGNLFGVFNRFGGLFLK